MATKEFDILALDGSNFPSWAIDLKVNLSTLGLYSCIDEIAAGIVTPSSMSNYSALKVKRNHIHPDLKWITVAEPPELIRLKCANHHHKGNTG